MPPSVFFYQNGGNLLGETISSIFTSLKTIIIFEILAEILIVSSNCHRAHMPSDSKSVRGSGQQQITKFFSTTEVPPRTVESKSKKASFEEWEQNWQDGTKGRSWKKQKLDDAETQEMKDPTKNVEDTSVGESEAPVLPHNLKDDPMVSSSTTDVCHHISENNGLTTPPSCIKAPDPLTFPKDTSSMDFMHTEQLHSEQTTQTTQAREPKLHAFAPRTQRQTKIPVPSVPSNSEVVHLAKEEEAVTAIAGALSLGKPSPPKDAASILAASDSDADAPPPHPHDSFVPMPFETGPGDAGTSGPRWSQIRRALTPPPRSLDALRAAVLTYAAAARRPPAGAAGPSARRFAELRRAADAMGEEKRAQFWGATLPGMVAWALALPALCPEPIPRLVQGRRREVLPHLSTFRAKLYDHRIQFA
jgi:hypothetical protein